MNNNIIKRLQLLLILILSINFGYSLQADENLFAYFQFENNYSDYMGINKVILTPINSPTFTTGYVGDSISCNGIDDYIDTNNLISYIDNVNNFTISFWVNEDSTDADTHFFSGADGGSNTNQYVFGNSLTRLTTQADSSADYRIDYVSPTPTNIWIFMTLTWNAQSNTLSVYKDGVLLGNDSVGTDANFYPTTSFQPVFCALARNGLGYIQQNKMLLDEVTFWNRTLNSTEINDLMINGVEFGGNPNLEINYIKPSNPEGVESHISFGDTIQINTSNEAVCNYEVYTNYESTLPELEFSGNLNTLDGFLHESETLLYQNPTHEVKTYHTIVYCDDIYEQSNDASINWYQEPQPYIQATLNIPEDNYIYNYSETEIPLVDVTLTDESSYCEISIEYNFNGTLYYYGMQSNGGNLYWQSINPIPLPKANNQFQHFELKVICLNDYMQEFNITEYNENIFNIYKDMVLNIDMIVVEPINFFNYTYDVQEIDFEITTAGITQDTNCIFNYNDVLYNMTTIDNGQTFTYDNFNLGEPINETLEYNVNFICYYNNYDYNETAPITFYKQREPLDFNIIIPQNEQIFNYDTLQIEFYMLTNYVATCSHQTTNSTTFEEFTQTDSSVHKTNFSVLPEFKTYYTTFRCYSAYVNETKEVNITFYIDEFEQQINGFQTAKVITTQSIEIIDLTAGLTTNLMTNNIFFLMIGLSIISFSVGIIYLLVIYTKYLFKGGKFK